MSASMINVELGRAASAPFDINGSAERALAGVPSGTIRFSDFYGKSAGDPTTDPMWQWVRLLAHFDSIGGTVYTNSAAGHASAFAGPSKGAGCTFHTAPPVKWGGANYFNGANGAGAGWVMLSPVASIDLNVAYWTLEMYSYEVTGSLGSLVSHRTSGTAGWTFETSRFRANINGVWSDTQLSWTRPSFDTWHHIALVKDGSDMRAYVDGTLVDTLSGVTSINYVGTGANPVLGAGSQSFPQDNMFKGDMDDVRFTFSATAPGAARYNANFTVRTTPFPNS